MSSVGMHFHRDCLVESIDLSPMSVMSGGEGSVKSFVQIVERKEGSFAETGKASSLCSARELAARVQEELQPGQTRLACLVAEQRAAVDANDTDLMAELVGELARVRGLMDAIRQLEAVKSQAVAREDYADAMRAKRDIEKVLRKLQEEDKRCIDFSSHRFQQAGRKVKLMMGAVKDFLHQPDGRLDAMTTSFGLLVDAKLDEVGEKLGARAKVVGARVDASAKVTAMTAAMVSAQLLQVGKANLGAKTGGESTSPFACSDCNGSGKVGLFGPSGFGLFASACDCCGGFGQRTWFEAAQVEEVLAASDVTATDCGWPDVIDEVCAPTLCDTAGSDNDPFGLCPISVSPSPISASPAATTK